MVIASAGDRNFNFDRLDHGSPRRVLKDESYGVRWLANRLVRQLRVIGEPLCPGFLSTPLVGSRGRGQDISW